MGKRNKLRRKLTKWHQRIGVASAVFVLVLSVTGVLLNHTSSFHLDRIFIQNPFLLSLYGVQEPQINALELKVNNGESLWLSETGGMIYANDQRITECSGDFVGAVALEEYLAVACAFQIQLFTFDYQRIDVLDSKVDLPVPIQRMFECGDQVCLSVAGTNYQADFEALSWRLIASPEAESPAMVGLHTPPEAIVAAILKDARGRVISLEKVILDIHAGRYFGGLGPLFMDIIALLFIVVAITGFYMWSQKRRN